MTSVTLGPRLQEIADDFAAMPGREKLQLLLEFSRELPPLPERYAEHRDLLEQVPECQSPLFLAAEVSGDDTVHLFFEAPPEEFLASQDPAVRQFVDGSAEGPLTPEGQVTGKTKSSEGDA